jgi:hypothetical protein
MVSDFLHREAERIIDEKKRALEKGAEGGFVGSGKDIMSVLCAYCIKAHLAN